MVKIYEVGSSGFGTAKGYEDYKTKGSQFGDGTAEDAMNTLTEKLIRDAIWGTPEQCVDRVIDIHERLNPSQFILLSGLGTMTAAQQESSMRLFAEKVLPKVAHLRKEPVAA